MMDIEELKAICDLTYKLTELRQNECKHLAIENVAAEIFSKLLAAFEMVNMVNIDRRISRDFRDD